jgi:hypothetical protein
MYDINSVTVGELFTTLRYVGVLVTILVAGWKAHAMIQPVMDFLKEAMKLMKRGERHMDVMEESMSLLLNNHLTHIGNNVHRFTHNQVRATEAEQVEYEVADAAMEAEGSPPLSDPQVPQV